MHDERPPISVRRRDLSLVAYQAALWMLVVSLELGRPPLGLVVRARRDNQKDAHGKKDADGLDFS